jgi:cell division protein FtsQ
LIKKVETQQEKVIDYQYIRNIKNKEVRKSRFKKTISQRVFRTFLMITLIGEVIFLGYYGIGMLTRSPWFVLTKIEITGTHKTNAEDLKKLILSRHPNSLLLDLTEMKLQLESQPWIQSAIIWRELPDNIRIHVTERVPVALVLAGNLYLVDRSGRVIDTFDHDPEYASLPVLTGISDVSKRSAIAGSIAVLESISKDQSILHQVSEVHSYDVNSTIVYLRGIPFGLLVSKDDILPMIQKFVANSEFVKRNFANMKLVDLRYRGQIILKDIYREQL